MATLSSSVQNSVDTVLPSVNCGPDELSVCMFCDCVHMHVCGVHLCVWGTVLSSAALFSELDSA